MDKYKDVSLTWFGDITSIGGRAQYARSLLEPLIKGGAHVKLEPANFGLPPADLSSWWHDAINNGTKISPGFVKINHSHPAHVTANILGGPNILLTHWDTYKIPRAWADMINKNHTELWTTNKSSVYPESIEGVEIPTNFIPVPIEVDLQSKAANIADIKDNTIVFGFTGFWDQRSNIQDLIIAYVAEFSANENVALLIKTNGKDPADANQRAQILDLVRKIKGTVAKPGQPPVIILQDIFSQVQMDAIIKRINIYVSSARGGSTDITLGKCMAMGKQCIVPDVGIGKDYLDSYGKYDKVMRPVPCYREPQTSHPDSNPIDFWGRPDPSALMNHMKQAYLDYVMCDSEMTKQSKKLAHSVTTDYSVDVCVDRLATQIRRFKAVPMMQFV